MKWKFIKQIKKSSKTPKLCTWKLKNQDVVVNFNQKLFEFNYVRISERSASQDQFKLLQKPAVFQIMENCVGRPGGGTIH